MLENDLLRNLLQNATPHAGPAPEQPIRTVTSAKKAGRRMSRKPVSVSDTVKTQCAVIFEHQGERNIASNKWERFFTFDQNFHQIIL